MLLVEVVLVELLVVEVVLVELLVVEVAKVLVELLVVEVVLVELLIVTEVLIELLVVKVVLVELPVVVVLVELLVWHQIKCLFVGERLSTNMGILIESFLCHWRRGLGVVLLSICPVYPWVHGHSLVPLSQCLLCRSSTLPRGECRICSLNVVSGGKPPAYFI